MFDTVGFHALKYTHVMQDLQDFSSSVLLFS